MNNHPETSFTNLISQRNTIICCGSGGVGKTTVAAAMALCGATQGRKTCVVTVDPARRLADALGIGQLDNSPRKIEGPWPGELWAVMLDTKGTFDELIRNYSSDQAQVESILHNRLYKNLSGSFSGTQEYMAMEKLYELHSDSRFDFIVVDTPPTRNALDFLDAPRQLGRFLDNKIFRLLMMPARTYLKAVSVATRTFLRAISKVVGAEVVADAVAFFQAFEGLEQGFRDRAGKVESVLSDPSTAFVLMTSPRTEAVDEAMFFAKKLAESKMKVEGLVVNRVHPSFKLDNQGPIDLAQLTTRVESQLGKDLLENWAQMNLMADQEATHVRDLRAKVSPAPVVEIPLLDGDVHDLDSVRSIASFLV